MSLIICEKFSDTSQLLLRSIGEENIADLLTTANLGESNQRFFATLKTEKRQREWLTWHAMIRNHFREIDPNLEAVYDQRGIPCLTDPSRGQLSVSHGGNLVGVMISRGACGIDIESLNRDFTRTQARFMSDNERFILGTLHHIAQPAALAWCAKEAAYKIGGVIGADFMRDLEIIDTSSSYDTITVRICTKKVKVMCKVINGNLIVFGNEI